MPSLAKVKRTNRKNETQLMLARFMALVNAMAQHEYETKQRLDAMEVEIRSLRLANATRSDAGE